MGSKILFCGRDLKIFSPVRDTSTALTDAFIIFNSDKDDHARIPSARKIDCQIPSVIFFGTIS